MRHFYFRLILGIVFYRLHDFQLRYREHSFCGDVSCSRHCISGFGLFALEERKG